MPTVTQPCLKRHKIAGSYIHKASNENHGLALQKAISATWFQSSAVVKTRYVFFWGFTQRRLVVSY